MKKKISRRFLSLFLSGTMAFSLCPQVALGNTSNHAVGEEKGYYAEQADEETSVKKATPSDAKPSAPSAGEETDKATPSDAKKGPTAGEVQKLIGALPDAEEITAENLEEVSAQLEEIAALLEQMSEEEYGKLDLGRYEEAKEAAGALSNKVMKASVQAEYNGPAVVLGTDQIQNGSHIYFGHIADEKTQTRPEEWGRANWRVLNNEGTSLFLLTEENFAKLKFNNTNNSRWNGSRMKAFLEELSKRPEFLSDIERNAVLDTVHTDNGIMDSTLDRLFLLSKEEVEEYLPNRADRVPTENTIGLQNEDWWLRTPGEVEGRVAYVDELGSIQMQGANASHPMATRIAMRLDLNSVLFTTDANMLIDDANPQNLGRLTAVKDTGVKAWRMTLKDENISFAATREDSGKTLTPGAEIALDYTGSFSSANDTKGRWISAILADDAENVLYYGQLANYDTANNKGKHSSNGDTLQSICGCHSDPYYKQSKEISYE